MFEYNWMHYAPWGHELAVYFFVIGMAAMTFVLAAAPHVFGGGAKALDNVRLPGTIIALILVAICGPLLILDLGQPARFLYPLIYFHASSPLSWGALLLVLFGISMLAFAYFLWSGKESALRPTAIVGSLLALSMPLYTGVDLMANQARELWASPALPLLFVALSVTSGVAVLGILSLVRGGGSDSARFLRHVLLGSVALTLLLFLTEIIRMTFGSAELQDAWTIINSEFAFRFWGMTLVIGILVPLALLLPAQFSRQPIVVTAAAVAGAVGAFTFREVILYAGQLVQTAY